jgi:hypothetical protein
MLGFVSCPYTNAHGLMKLHTRSANRIVARIIVVTFQGRKEESLGRLTNLVIALDQSFSDPSVYSHRV